MTETDVPSAPGEPHPDRPDLEFPTVQAGDPCLEAVTSRGGLVRRAALLGGAALTAGGIVTALPRLASSARPTARDVRILNYVLRLERLKLSFYEEAADGGGLTGELLQLARVLGRHERRHVAFFEQRLRGKAQKERRFDFGDATTNPDRFAQAARTLEETAVAAYIGQGANLSRSQMVPFAQITSVEARHAAWIAGILGRHPAPLVADEAKTPAQVVAAIEETGFEGRS
jgi:Ferritin-like domain